MEKKENKLGKMSKLIIVLTTFSLLNFGAIGYVMYRLHTLSYLDIADAPSIFYTNKHDLYRYAAELGEDEGRDYLIGLKKRLEKMHGIIIDDDAVVASSAEFKLEFKNTDNKKR